MYWLFIADFCEELVLQGVSEWVLFDVDNLVEYQGVHLVHLLLL